MTRLTRNYMSTMELRIARIESAVASLARDMRAMRAGIAAWAPAPAGLTPEEQVNRIRTIVAGFYGCNAECLSWRIRTEHAAWARHVCWHLAKKYVRVSSNQLGKWFKRDHAAVRHGLRHVAERMECEKGIADQVGKLERLVGREISQKNGVKKI